MKRLWSAGLTGAKWQINDCWPGVSWSGIDYDGRWKALHYAAREFYAPRSLILTKEEDTVTFSVSNESTMPFKGMIRWKLVKNDQTVVRSGCYPVALDGLSATDLGQECYGDLTEEQRCTCALVGELLDENGNCINDRLVLFVPSKHFKYKAPHIEAELGCDEEGYFLTLKADAFAQNVWLEFGSTDCVFSRNFMNLTDAEPITVRLSQLRGAEPAIEDLQILCVNTTA